MTQTPSFVITVLSGEELFFDAPTALADGTLVLPLARSGRGTAVISAIIRDDGDTGGENQNASEPFEFELIVDGFEELPGFFLQPTLSVLDGAGLENFTKFADVSTLAGLDEAAGPTSTRGSAQVPSWYEARGAALGGNHAACSSEHPPHIFFQTAEARFGAGAAR